MRRKWNWCHMINKMSDQHGRDSNSDNDDFDAFNLHDLDLGFGNGQRNIQSMVEAYTHEYDTLDHTLDELDSWMNKLEEQTDNLNSQMDELLQSSKQARLELQQQNADPSGDRSNQSDMTNGDIQALQARLEAHQLDTAVSAEVDGIARLNESDLQSLKDLHAKVMLNTFPGECEVVGDGSNESESNVTVPGSPSSDTDTNASSGVTNRTLPESIQSDLSDDEAKKH